MADHGHGHGHGHSHGHDNSPAGGTMDISDKVQSWLAFWNVTKWGVVSLIGLAIILAIFRTHNGMY